MKTKVTKFMYVLLAMFCVVGLWSTSALAEEEESALSVGAAVDFATKYVSRGNNFYGPEENNAVFQPAAYLEYAVNDSVSVGYYFWANYDADGSLAADGDKGFDEYDHEFYLTYAVSDATSLGFGYILYDYPDFSEYDTSEAYVSIETGLNDYLSAGFKLLVDVDTFDGYYYATANLDGEYPINDNAALFGSVGLGYVDYGDDEDFSDFSDVPVTVGASYDFGNGFSGYASFNHSFSLDDNVNDNEDESWFMTGLAFDY